MDKRFEILQILSSSILSLQIIYYRPDRRQYNSYIESEGPLPLPVNYEQYTFDTLPEQFFNKYRRAWKFVNIIRSLRCKIIMYTNDGKCRLMETSIEFDVRFCVFAFLINQNNFSLLI
jgi:hypothetical protein